MAFDIDGARKSGYSDDEIASYLSQQNNFDYEGAKQAGYSPQEVIDHLTPKQAPAPQPSVAQNAVSDIKDLLTPYPVRAAQAIPSIAASYAQGGLGKVLGDTAANIVEPIAHPIDYTKEHPVQQALNLALMGPGLADLGESVSKGMSTISDKLAGTLAYKPTPAEIESAVGNVQDALKTSLKKTTSKLNAVKSKFSEAPDFQARVNRLGESSSLADLRDEYNSYMQTRAPQMEESGMTPPPGTQVQQPPNVQVFKQGEMGGGVSPNTGEPLPKVTIWGVKGDPAEVSKLGFGDSPGSVPQDVLQKFGLLDNKGNPAQIFQTPKQEIGYLVNLRQELQDQISNRTLNQTGNAVKAVGTADEGTIRGMISKINSRIAQLPGGGVLRDAETHFSQARSVFDDLQSKMAEPGQAENFLKRVLTSDNPMYKDYRNKLATLEHSTGQPVISKLADMFKQQAQGSSYEELKHPIASLIKSGAPQEAVNNLARGTAKLGLLPSKAALYRPFNTPQMQSLRDKLLNQEQSNAQ